MTQIIIRRFKNGNVIYVYNVTNTSRTSVNFNSPIEPMPLPESRDDAQILVKTQGNSTTLDHSWVMKNSNNSVVSHHNGAYDPGEIKTIWEQLRFWDNRMIGAGIDSAFDFIIGDNLTNLTNDVPTGMIYYQKKGYSTKFMVNLSSPNVLTLSATFNMIIGDVITSHNSDVPSQPLNFSLEQTNANTVNISWDDPTISGSSEITDYVIQKRYGEEEWEANIVDKNTNSLVLSGFINGKIYEVKMYARNNHGAGTRTSTREILIN